LAGGEKSPPTHPARDDCFRFGCGRKNRDKQGASLPTLCLRAGTRNDFIFLKYFHATRIDDDKWNLGIEEPDLSVPASLTMTIEGESARVSGPQTLVGPSGEATLQKQEVVTDPRIELVPIRDSALFERYLDTALFNLDLSWTAP
jgi:hypothetical protein